MTTEIACNVIYSKLPVCPLGGGSKELPCVLVVWAAQVITRLESTEGRVFHVARLWNISSNHEIYVA
jgi:hypothetical protein